MAYGQADTFSRRPANNPCQQPFQLYNWSHVPIQHGRLANMPPNHLRLSSIFGLQQHQHYNNPRLVPLLQYVRLIPLIKAK